MLTSEVITTSVFMFFIAVFVEKYYVSRVGVLPNLLMILFPLMQNFSTLPTIFQGWLGLGVLAGIISLFFYAKDKELPDEIYDITYPFYGLKTILGIYLGINVIAADVSGVSFGIGIAAVIWYVAIKYFDNDSPFGIWQPK